MSYVSTVVDFLDTRLENAVSLTAEDYSVIAEWEKQQIPLAIALNSLERSVSELDSEDHAKRMFEELSLRVINEFSAWLRSNDN